MRRLLDLLALAGLAACLSGQTLIGELTGTTAQAHLGAGLLLIHDVNGDGTRDFAVAGVTNAASSSSGRTPYVTIYSGADDTVIATWTQFGLTLGATGTHFRLNLAPAGDLNQDGIGDVLVAGWETPDTSQTPSINGAVWALSGANGSLLRTFTGANLGDDYGKGLAGIGDVSGDGIPDIAIGAPQTNVSSAGGYFEVRSGADGSLLFTGPAISTSGSFGFSILGLGDVDGDTVPDYAVSDPSMDVVFVFAGPTPLIRLYSGLTHGIIRTLTAPAGIRGFGGGLALIGDTTGDGVSELAVTQYSNGMMVSAFNPVTGTSLFTSSSVGGWHAHALASVTDLDQDGIRDLVLGNVNGGSILFGMVRAYAFSGANGSTLLATPPVLALTTTNGNPPPQATADLGDLHGDGIGDFAVGTPQSTAGNGIAGTVQLFTNNAALVAGTTILGGGTGGPSLSLQPLVMGATAFGQVSGATPASPGFIVFHLGPPSPFTYQGGTIWLDPAAALSWVAIPIATDPAGSLTFPVTIAFNHATAGAIVTAQAYVPGASFAASITNGLQIVAGY